MTTSSPACFTVHGLPHLRVAMAAGAATGRAIVVMSAAGASGYAGAGWFLSMAEQGRAEFPDVALTAWLDCDDRGGDVLAAFAAGARHVIFTGHPEAGRRLNAIAQEYGAAILSERPLSCDLLNASDPAWTARKWCETSAR